MSDASNAEERIPDEPGQESASVGGENAEKPETTHDAGPHDQSAKEPLGPLTPDDERPLGDTPEAHDEIIPEDLPPDHPGRKEAERQAATGDGTVRGTT